MTSCMDFDGKTVDDFTRSQMWDCQESRDRILEECRYSMLATDFLARGLSSLERTNLEMDYLEALANYSRPAKCSSSATAGNCSRRRKSAAIR